MVFLADQGYRVLAHSRRGHGRSVQTWYGSNTDTSADVLRSFLNTSTSQDAMMVGHPHGGGEVTRFLSKNGTSRVKRAVLVGVKPPLLLRTTPSAEGIEKHVFGSFRQAMHKGRAQSFLEVPSGPFFGFNRRGPQKR